ELVSLPRNSVLSGPREDSGVARGHGHLARLPAHARRAPDDSLDAAAAFPAELDGEGHDRHADHHPALRPLREHLELAAAADADRLRRRGDDDDVVGVRLRLPGGAQLRVRGEPARLIALRLLSRPGCHLCDEMRKDVDAILADAERSWT